MWRIATPDFFRAKYRILLLWKGRGMRIRDRDIKRIVTAPFQRRYWSALVQTFRIFDRPMEALRRYASNSGEYPWSPVLRTPAGYVRVTLHSYHDLLTVNEIFCRGDYGRGAPQIVMDIGANRGLAALSS